MEHFVTGYEPATKRHAVNQHPQSDKLCKPFSGVKIEPFVSIFDQVDNVIQAVNRIGDDTNLAKHIRHTSYQNTIPCIKPYQTYDTGLVTKIISQILDVHHNSSKFIDGSESKRFKILSFGLIYKVILQNIHILSNKQFLKTVTNKLYEIDIRSGVPWALRIYNIMKEIN